MNQGLFFLYTASRLVRHAGIMSRHPPNAKCQHYRIAPHDPLKGSCQVPAGRTEILPASMYPGRATAQSSASTRSLPYMRSCRALAGCSGTQTSACLH